LIFSDIWEERKNPTFGKPGSENATAPPKAEKKLNEVAFLLPGKPTIAMESFIKMMVQHLG